MLQINWWRFSEHAELSNCNYENLVSSQHNSLNSTNSSLGPSSSENSVDVACVNLSNHGLPSVVTEQVPLKGGGSSDWKSTLYSRGSYTAPDMDKAQFRAFTKSGDYVPVESLRNGKFMKGGYKKKSKKGTKKYKKKGGGVLLIGGQPFTQEVLISHLMDQKQFRAFTKTAEYLPNESMRTAAFMK